MIAIATSASASVTRSWTDVKRVLIHSHNDRIVAAVRIGDEFYVENLLEAYFYSREDDWDCDRDCFAGIVTEPGVKISKSRYRALVLRLLYALKAGRSVEGMRMHTPFATIEFEGGSTEVVSYNDLGAAPAFQFLWEYEDKKYLEGLQDQLQRRYEELRESKAEAPKQD